MQSPLANYSIMALTLLPPLQLLHRHHFSFHGLQCHSSISASISLSSYSSLFNGGASVSPCLSISISALELKKLQIKGNDQSFQVSYRYSSHEDDDDEEGGGEERFDEAVVLFNEREYYKCHDSLESLWNRADEPRRTLFHGILQCAVGFHHLLNNNHKGAMMELGEGLCKLRKMNYESGPFYRFEQDISAALDFIYLTQIELAACSEDICVTMDRSERSYQLLGGYAAGQQVYRLQPGPDQTTYIVFSPAANSIEEGGGTASTPRGHPPRVKLPLLNATQHDLPQLD